MKEMNIQFHKTRPQNPFDDGAKARLHRMGLLRIDGSVDEATLDALSRAYERKRYGCSEASLLVSKCASR